ncbi:MAG: poly(R)-hydroxyalkanoic acid synthase subunit PhaE [Bernardetiaceae bacterium]
MMGSLYPETSSDKSKELFEGWWNEQRDIVQQIINPATPEEAIKNAPTHMQKWMESQMKFVEKLMEFYKSMGGQYNQGVKFEVPDMFKDNYAKWQEFMIGTTKMLADAMKGQTPAYAAASQLQGWAKTYTDMYGQWETISKNIRQGMNTMQAFKSPFSPDAYKQMTEQMMGINPADTLKKSAEYVDEMFKKAMENYKTWNESTTQMSKTITEGMKGFPMMSGMSMDGNFIANMSAMLSENMEKSMAPFAHFQQKGKNAEVMEMMKIVPKEYSNFVVKSAEMQGHIYTATQQAFPAVIEHFAAHYEKEQKLPTFDEFFKAWVARMEKDITGVLESKEYTALQNEVSKSSLTVKQQMDKLAEMAFEGTPLTTRSEADDLANELAALRKKVRALEKKIAGIESDPTEEAAEVEAKKAMTRRTTASTAKK